MGLFGMGKTRRGANQFLPRLETLENRWCPSATVTLVDHTLLITGNGGDDTVLIDDDGAGGITVTTEGTTAGNGGNGHGNGSASHGGDNGGSSANASSASGASNGDDDTGGGDTGGAQVQTFTDVERVIVRTGAGDDLVQYRLTGPLTTDRDVLIDLGQGDDIADLDFSAGVDGADLDVDLFGAGGADDATVTVGDVTDAAVDVRAKLGAGDDALDATLTGTFSGADVRLDVRGAAGDDLVTVDATGLDIDASSRLDLRLYGNGGNDEFSVDYQGVMEGELRLRTAAGSGDDVVAANLTLESGSTGEARADIRGDSGNDDLTLNIEETDPGAAQVKALLDGGAGTDVCTATDNVEVRNCEDVA